MSQAFILAAGVGSRLKGLKEGLPKCLLSFKGQTFLERHLEALIQRKINPITIVVGYAKEKVMGWVKSQFPKASIQFIFNPLFESTNNSYSLYLALKENPQDFFLCDGDLLCDPTFWDDLAASHFSAAMMVENNLEKVDEEAMKVKCVDQKMIALGKNIPMNEAAGEFIGLSRFDQDWAMAYVKIYEEGGVGANDHLPLQGYYYEDVFSLLLRTELTIGMVSTQGKWWREIDTVEDYENL